MAEVPTKIAVTTPTGNVGRHVVRALVQAGADPLLLLRDASRLDDDLREQVHVVELDQADEGAVVAATRGVDALFWVDPPTEDPDPLAACDRMTRSVAAAVELNDIERVVFQSSIGAEQRHGLGEIDGLGATEEALDRSGAHVVHLRCGYFFTNLLLDPPALLERGEILTAMPVDMPLPWVSPRDIGEVAAGWLLNTQWLGRHVRAVHGPEDLSFEQVAAILTVVLGREVVAQHVPPEELREVLLGAAMTQAQAEALVGMSRAVDPEREPSLPRGVTTTTPTHLGGWAWDHLRPLV